ncbi:MAG TPA: alpha-mannosidase [Ruminococcaceae bacterium]|nr:alpha-mannosidase [Oscillospiraceae bacterium]
MNREPQFLVYVNGQIAHGLDLNHRFIDLPDGNEFDIFVYAYTGLHSCRHYLVANLFAFNETVQSLYYDLKVPSDVLKMYDENDKEFNDILLRVNEAVNRIDLSVPRSEAFYRSAAEALSWLEENFYGDFCKEQEVNCICIGHTHIDVAWLWTLAQTREKAVRSFSTVVSMMEKYPEYKFMSSQAQLYQYVKEDSPVTYEKIKKLVAEGRWEVEGAMWVEADCNLTSGESLVRQVLFGKRFFQKEFGVDSKVLWLPDVFGYSAALPQILRKSGVDKFVTSKISWNEYNMLPYDTFLWSGIDSTEIFSYFLTAQRYRKWEKPETHATYTAMLEPDVVKGAWNRYQQKHLNNEVMITFGHGDGGGGPMEEHIETHRRLQKGLPGVPNTKIEFAGDFLNRVVERTKDNPKLPKWIGELYLEFHRGTYTSNALNKRNNRKCEFLYQNTELFCEINRLINKKAYPQAKINEGWECILLNQFHDIIPGSSIFEVYEESTRQYDAIKAEGNRILNDAQQDILSNIKTNGGIAVFNPLSFTHSGDVEVDGKHIFVRDIPAKGWKVVQGNEGNGTVTVDEKRMENDFFVLEFAPDYTISRLYDKRAAREVLSAGERGNVLEAYEDFPREYDAWEISCYYKEKRREIDDVSAVEVLDDGSRKGVKITRKFLHSTVEQKVWIYSDTDRIDFETAADWNEEHLLIKTAFPVEINADKATYEIQFGSVERPTHINTSWDAAKFEVCAHKYADLSECDYGVSILNDCKYGHDIHNGVMRLTLIKCATHPNIHADRCHHDFTYSLRPHVGSFRHAGTIQAAYDLNNPLCAFRIGEQDGALPEAFSLVSSSAENVVVDTVKKAEDSDSTVVRMYESWNKRCNTTLTFGVPFEKAFLCDLMENELEELNISENSVTVPVKPFEIITIKLV